MVLIFYYKILLFGLMIFGRVIKKYWESFYTYIKKKNMNKMLVKLKSLIYHKCIKLNIIKEKNQKKIHRRYIPKLLCRVPKGIVSKLVSKFNNYDWHYNYDLIKLRRDLKIRIHARSELCETLNILSSALIVHCNLNLYSEYLFEIKVPFEIIASSMNMLHIYDNGRKSYDPPLHALRVLEKLKYLIILRAKDTDTGHYKPLRIWLTKNFFISRGITLKRLRFYLHKYENWIIRNNLTSNFLYYRKKHLSKMRIIGIDLIKYPSLRNLLIKIKKNILGEKFILKINNNIKFYSNNFKNRKNFVTKEFFNNNIKNIENKKSNFWYCKFVHWSYTKMPYQVLLLENSLRKEFPGLIRVDPEKYYKILLKRGHKL